MPTTQLDSGSAKQQHRDLLILQLLSILPTHAFDLERQLLAMGAWWSLKGDVHKHLKGLQAEGLVTNPGLPRRRTSPPGLYDH
jgi:hypothetical protein